MWSAAVVIMPPSIDDLARFEQTHKYVFVEALIAQPAVEAFDKGVLQRLAWLDVVPGGVLRRPSEDRDTSQFCPIVADDHCWCGPLAGEAVELTHHPHTT